jgi:hypothetical protein
VELEIGDSVMLSDTIGVEIFLNICEENGITWANGSSPRDRDFNKDITGHWDAILVMSYIDSSSKRLYLATTESSYVKRILTIDSFLED